MFLSLISFSIAVGQFIHMQSNHVRHTSASWSCQCDVDFDSLFMLRQSAYITSYESQCKDVSSHIFATSNCSNLTQKQGTDPTLMDSIFVIPCIFYEEDRHHAFQQKNNDNICFVLFFTMLTMATQHSQAPPLPTPPHHYLLTGQLCDYWESMALCATPELLSSPRSSWLAKVNGQMWG